MATIIAGSRTAAQHARFQVFIEDATRNLMKLRFVAAARAPI